MVNPGKTTSRAARAAAEEASLWRSEHPSAILHLCGCVMIVNPIPSDGLVYELEEN
jgi:hypothetical protein